MSGLGYGAVANTGFTGFNRSLDEGAWGAISVKGWDGKGKDVTPGLMEAPLGVAWKVMLRGAIGQLIAALGASNLAELDEEWDSSQRRLYFRIAEGRNAKDRGVRAAADRLAVGLLMNGGTAQTQLDFDTEVDFGWTQIDRLKSDPRVAEDVKKVKIQDVLSDVEKATNALAEGLGRHQGKKRKSRSVKVRDAMKGCVAAFNHVHEGLLLLQAATPKGSARDRIATMLEPLDDLLERSASSPAPADDLDTSDPTDTPAPNPDAKPA